jgi:hypothetical protein
MALEYDALDVQNAALGESWMSLHCATGVSLFTRHELPSCFLLFTLASLDMVAARDGLLRCRCSRHA